METQQQLHIDFLKQIRRYLSDETDWDSVHRASLELIVKNADDFPSKPVTEELHMVFLTDSEDDPQFREDDSEIRRLLPLAEEECSI